MSIFRTRPLHLNCSCLGLGNLTVSQPSCFLLKNLSALCCALGTIMFFTKSSIRPSIYIGIVNMFFNSSQRRRGHSPKTFFTIKRDYFNTFVQQIRETLSTSHKMVRELCDRCILATLQIRESETSTTKEIIVNNCSGVAPFECLAAIPPEERMRAQLLPGYPSLDRSCRDVGFGFELRISLSHRFRVDVEHRLDTPDFACPQWLCKAGCRDVFTSLFQVAANPLISSSLDLSELKLLTPVFISSDSTK
ncbi:hypothetical protein T265_00002 [Opisthorchis viverrini]|uniref:Uncharacterized protein n=1 Tax=Opisthorchis viverrini TaxID=6198 RepID=A0A075A6W5_OPIVI|nr:hypothetical protein T265_00002 [Opisthorchis viverrini]KER34112.1 hypothetical protein T265_00002 [Opisthorchis viverrini]